MGKQINYYMEYERFLRIAEKALALGCEIIPNAHTEQIVRGASPELITPECRNYLFHVPEAGAVTFKQDMNGKYYAESNYSASGNALIEASFSYIVPEKRRISRARLFCITGYYGADGVFVDRPECVTRIYNALVRVAKREAPYTALTESGVTADGVPYDRTRKVYISERCLRLRDAGYRLL